MLAEEVIKDIEESADDLDLALLEFLRCYNGEGYVGACIDEYITGTKTAFLEEPRLDDLSMLIELASGTPITISGVGTSFDAGLGPADPAEKGTV